MLFKFSLVMVFLIHVFIEVIFEKLFSHEAPVMGRVTAMSNNLYKKSNVAFVRSYK